MAEALEGLHVIRAFNKQKYFVRESEIRVNRKHKALFSAETLNLWLAFYCDFYGALLVFAVAAFAVSDKENLGASKVGLCFSNTIQVSYERQQPVHVLLVCAWVILTAFTHAVYDPGDSLSEL